MLSPLVLPALLGAAHAVTAPADLVGWWPGEDTADDATGAHDGTLDNGSYDSGMVGSAFYFGSGAGMVEVAETDGLDPMDGDFSVESWIRTPSANVAIIGCKRGTGTEVGWCLYLRYGYMFARVADDVGNLGRWDGSTSGLLADDVWHHMAMTVDRADSGGGHLLRGRRACGLVRPDEPDRIHRQRRPHVHRARHQRGPRQQPVLRRLDRRIRILRGRPRRGGDLRGGRRRQAAG